MHTNWKAWPLCSAFVEPRFSLVMHLEMLWQEAYIYTKRNYCLNCETAHSHNWRSESLQQLAVLRCIHTLGRMTSRKQSAVLRYKWGWGFFILWWSREAPFRAGLRTCCPFLSDSCVPWVYMPLSYLGFVCSLLKVFTPVDLLWTSEHLVL